MRIWDIDPGFLNDKSLLGEHREIHGIFNILTQGKKGYARHPETLRWNGCLPALCLRHAVLVGEMHLRGFNHQSPMVPDRTAGSPVWPQTFIDPPHHQVTLLREKYRSKPMGRIPLPRNSHTLWAAHKYSVMARDPALYSDIGPRVAHKKISFPDLFSLVVTILRQPPTPGRRFNALAHMWGYATDKPDLDIRALPPLDLLGLIREQTRTQEIGYLDQSTALGELEAFCRDEEPWNG